MNPYDYYRTARDVGGMGRVDSLGTAARATGEAIDNSYPLLKTGLSTTGRIAGRVAPAALGVLDYMDNKARGEGEARAITSAVGSGLGGWGGAAGGAAIGTMLLPGVGTVLGGIAGGLLGSKVGGEAVDTGWKVFTDDDGLQPGTEAYKKHYAGLLPQAQADYNNNPTPEKKQKLQQVYANATGTSVPLKASDAGDTLDIYSRNVGDFLEKYMDPDSTLNSRYRQLIREDEDRADRRMFRNAAFEGRFGLGKGAIDNYYKRSANAASDAATLARAGSTLLGSGY